MFRIVRMSELKKICSTAKDSKHRTKEVEKDL